MSIGRFKHEPRRCGVLSRPALSWPDPSCRSTPYESRSTWFSDLQAIAYATGERHSRLLWGL